MIRFILGAILILGGVAVLAGALRFRTTVEVPDRDDDGNVRRDSYNRKLTKSETTINVIRWPGAIAVAFGLVFSIWGCTRLVKSTEVGVPVSLGKAGAPLDSGLHFVTPWTDVVKFSTTVQTRDLDIAVNGSDGGTMTIKATVRYRIEVGGEDCSVTDLFRRVRSESKLESLVVDRESDDVTRSSFNKRPAFVGYTAEREQAVGEIVPELGGRFETQCVTLDRFLITGMDPSPKVQESIDAAIAAEQKVNQAKQDAQARREAAQGEADALVTSAQGKKEAAELEADANETLTASLTDQVLAARMIEAIGENDNVVLIPTGANGVTPLIQVQTPGSGG